MPTRLFLGWGMLRGVCLPLLQLIIVVVLCSVWSSATSPSTANFYSFGFANGDRVLPRGADSDSGFLNLSVPFPFYGKARRLVSVSNIGLVLIEDTLTADFRYSLVLPFGAQVDTSSAGQVFYRTSTNNTILTATANRVKTAFIGLYQDFKPTLALIVTWIQVGYFNAHSIPNNTYQAVLLTNGTLSFSIFIYPLGGIQWTSTNDGGGVHGFDGDAAIVGFVDDMGQTDLLPGSGRNVTYLSTASNVNMSGVWVFRIDKAIAGPLLNGCAIEYQYCDYNAHCIDRKLGFQCVCNTGFSGDGQTCTRDEGSGSNPNQGSCIEAKYTTCCYGSHCQSGDCFCDPHCYFVGDCCDDMTTTCPISAIGVLVNFQVSEIQVREGTSVSVCVQSWSADVQQQPVLVLVATHDGTARAGKDYAGRAYPLLLQGNSTVCVQSEVYGDQAIVDQRDFTFRLSSNSSLVHISTGTTVVMITDSSAATVVFTRSTYTVQRSDVVTLCVRLNGTCEREVGVVFSTTSGTALGGVDYLDHSMEVVFPIGTQPVACVEYQTLAGNGISGNSSYFIVTLTSTDKAVLGTPLVTTVTIEGGSTRTSSAPGVGGDASSSVIIIVVATVGSVASFVTMMVAVVISVACGISQFRKYYGLRSGIYASNRKSLEVKQNHISETGC